MKGKKSYTFQPNYISDFLWLFLSNINICMMI